MEKLNNFKNKIRVALQNFRQRKVTNVKVNFIEVRPIGELSVRLAIEDQLSVNKGETQHNSAINEDDENDDKNDETEHVKGINFIIGIVNLFGGALGLQANMNWKFNTLTFFTFCILLSFISLDSYTIYMYKDNFFKIIECFSLMGMLIPAMVKLRISCVSVKEAMAVYLFVRDVYHLNSYGIKAEILKENTQKMIKQIIFLIVILLAAFACYAGYPLYKLICYGELIPLLTLEIPFVDQNTTFGFIFANIVMLTFGVYGVLGNIAFDVFFALNVLLYSSLVKMLKYDFEQLENMWENEDESAGVDFRNAFLRNIMVKFGDVDRYVRSISNIYSDFLFVQVASAYLCIAMALFAVTVNNWMSGVGFVIFSFTEMFLLCYLGTTIKIQNDELCCIIYDHPWYLYQAKTQKFFLSLLYFGQQAKELTIGSFALLNVETGLQITKSIYSYLTMLIKFIE